MPFGLTVRESGPAVGASEREVVPGATRWPEGDSVYVVASDAQERAKRPLPLYVAEGDDINGVWV